MIEGNLSHKTKTILARRRRMKRWIWLVLLLIGIYPAVASSDPPEGNQLKQSESQMEADEHEHENEGQENETDGSTVNLAHRYIVVLDELLTPDEVANKVRDLATRHKISVGHIYDTAINGFSAKILPSRLTGLRNEPGVTILKDGLVQSFCHTGPQILPTGVNRIDADLSPTANINNIDNRVNADIAIIDTGVYPHADLNIVAAVDCTLPGCPSVAPSDPNGHGTHVAGISAAIDNTRYVVGVAPGARIWSVRVLSANGSGSISNIIAGIDYVTRNAASIEVANMSLGGPGRDTGNCGVNPSTGQVVDAFHRAICNSVNRGVVYTVAAGNSFQNAAGFTPAAYPEVITVSALADSDGRRGGLGPATSAGPDDTFATFSNFGAVVDLIAPGVDILSLA